MPSISRITLPSGTTYDIKDAVAREIAGGGVTFRGVTSTAIEDGDTITSYVVGTETFTVSNGDMVIYNKKEFIYSTSDNQWHELGDNTAFKALAYKDYASGSVIAAGNVTVTTKTNTNHTATVSSSSGEATYTPDGDVAAPVISVKTAGTTTTVHNPTAVSVAKSVIAAAPGVTAPTNNITYYGVTGETLSLYQLGYTTGDSIAVEDVTVKNGDAEYQASAPAFTGTGVRLVTENIPVPSEYTATFEGTSATVTVS